MSETHGNQEKREREREGRVSEGGRKARAVIRQTRRRERVRESAKEKERREREEMRNKKQDEKWQKD